MVAFSKYFTRRKFSQDVQGNKEYSATWKTGLHITIIEDNGKEKEK